MDTCENLCDGGCGRAIVNPYNDHAADCEWIGNMPEASADMLGGAL